MSKHNTIACPYDKVVHQVAADNLPVNFTVLTGLPMLAQTSQQNSVAAGQAAAPEEGVNMTYCQTHTSKKIKFFCKNDSELFCSKCILKHTSQKHEVVACSPKSKF